MPLALNVISKILCFVAAIMLFVWREGEEVSEVNDRPSQDFRGAAAVE